MLLATAHANSSRPAGCGAVGWWTICCSPEGGLSAWSRPSLPAPPSAASSPRHSSTATAQDLQYEEMHDHGSLFAARGLFGDELTVLLDELNEELAA